MGGGILMPPPMTTLVVAGVNLGQSGSAKSVGSLLAELVLPTATATTTVQERG